MGRLEKHWKLELLDLPKRAQYGPLCIACCAVYGLRANTFLQTAT